MPEISDKEKEFLLHMVLSTMLKKSAMSMWELPPPGSFRMTKPPPTDAQDQNIKKDSTSPMTKPSQNSKQITKDTRMSKDTAAADEQLSKLRDVGILRKGTKIIVPEDVGLDIAIRALQLQMEDEEQIISVNHVIDCDVAEGMVAFYRVLINEYGFVSNKGTKGFWGSTNKPSYIGIETSPGNVESVPNGNLHIPGIEGWLNPTFQIKDFQPVFAINGEIKGKDRHQVDRLVALVKAEYHKNSIYRGYSIVTSFPELDDSSSLEDFFPKFADLGEMMPEDLILNRETMEEIDVSLFTPIRSTARCREHKIPLKRGILLEGPYGTGKSLTAAVTANLCRQNGWTFVYLKDVTRLSQAYAFAERYQPAVIFSEDIDQVLQNAKGRDERINKILNEIDGIDTKGLEIITVLTTNHVENITTAMLRPGRLDTVVSVRAPNRNTVINLIKKYAGPILEENTNLDPAAALLEGEVPALIREVVERSKLSAIRRDGSFCLKGSDIELIARGMKNHMSLLKPKEQDTRSDIEKAAGVIASGIREKMTFTLSDLAGGLKQSNGSSERSAAAHT